MKQSILKSVTRILICLFLAGVVPVSLHSSLSVLHADAAKKKKKKKKSSSKKPTAKQKKQAKSYYKRGMDKAKNKDYTGALEDLKKSYKLVPSKQIKSMITKLTTRAKKQESAAPVAETVGSPAPVKKGPRINTTAYADELFNLTGELQASNKEIARATKYFQLEKPVKKAVALDSKPFFSRDDFEKEARLNPDNLYSQRQLGLHYEANGDYSYAKDVYLREVAKKPENPDVHYFLGSLYATLGEYKKSKNAFEEALYLDPNHGATIEAMSMYVGSKSQKKLSNDILRLSSEKAPDGPARKLTLIRGKMASGNYIEALNLSEEASKQFPSHSGFIQLMGENHLKLGKIDNAKKSFQRAVKLNPKEILPHISLADLYFDQGKFVYAALSFSDAVYLDPDNPDYRYMQGLSYFNANEWGRTAASWEDLLQYRPNDAIVRNLLPQTYYIMAVEYNRIGNPTMGRQAFKNALSINNNTSAWLSGAMGVLGNYYREKNLYSESLIAFQEVLELSPMDADAYMGIGITYWKMDEKQLARASWEKSLRIKPDHNESRGWLILSFPGS